MEISGGRRTSSVGSFVSVLIAMAIDISSHEPIIATMQHLELKIPPLIVLAIAAGLMWAIARTTPQWTLLYQAGFYSATLLLLGVAIMLIGVLAFRKASTTVDPRSPQSTSQVVRSGIYRFTRNLCTSHAGRAGCVDGVAVQGRRSSRANFLCALHHSVPDRAGGAGAGGEVWGGVRELSSVGEALALMLPTAVRHARNRSARRCR